MNKLILESKVIKECIYDNRFTSCGEPELVCRIYVESLVKKDPEIFVRMYLETTDLDIISKMDDLKVDDRVLVECGLVTEYKREKNEETNEMRRIPVDYYGLIRQIKKLPKTDDVSEPDLNWFVCEGKATSDCAKLNRKRNGEDVELYGLTVVSQLQERPDLDCQLQFQIASSDPKVTQYMRGIKKGEHVVVEGKYAMQFETDANGQEKVTFRYVICGYAKRWHRY